MDWYVAVLKKYAVFSGRARRKEYWYFILVNAVILFLLSMLDNVLGTYFYIFGPQEPIGIINALYSVLVIIPAAAVLIRRLHDVGKSGWWLFWQIASIVTILIVASMLPDYKVTDSLAPSSINSTVAEHKKDNSVVPETTLAPEYEDVEVMNRKLMWLGAVALLQLFYTLIIFYFLVKKSQPGQNKYGTNPLNIARV